MVRREVSAGRRQLLEGLLALGAVVGCRGSGAPATGAAPAGPPRRGLAPEGDPSRGETDGAAAQPEHALVVGGTGMLRAVAMELGRRGHATTVIARGRDELSRMADESDGRVHPLPLDYGDHDGLVAGLRAAVASRGPFALVVAWIHDSAPQAPVTVARVVAEGGTPVRYVHVLGSAADDPSGPDPQRRAAFEAIEGIAYEEVILGFVRDGEDSRWLTNAEIASGVLAAIDTPAPRSIVGTTRPWSARP